MPETKTIETDAGSFEAVLYHSRNEALSKRWVISVRDPANNLHQGFCRTRYGAERTIRKWIAKQEAVLREKNKKDLRMQQASLLLEKAGLSEWSLSRISRMPEISCTEMRPGELLCSYMMQGFHQSEWKATVFVNGEEVCSRSGRTRRVAERRAKKELQEAYQHDALRALGPEHAPD